MRRWKCPKCGKKNLSVTVVATQMLEQAAGGNYSTGEPDPVNGDHEWDENSPMYCRDCGYASIVTNFAVSKRSAFVSVWACTVAHEHGTDLYLGIDEYEVKKQLHEYVSENWDESEMGKQSPHNPDGAIATYFEVKAGKESFDIRVCEVAGVPEEEENAWIIINDATDAVMRGHVLFDREEAKAVAEDAQSEGMNCTLFGFVL